MHKLIKTYKLAIPLRLTFAIIWLCTTSFMPDSSSFMGIKRIVIDAGHGGKDSGCLGSSAKEKDVCLSIALNLGKAIENAYKNVEVIYTRKTDVFVELHERAQIANDKKADLFICIHANSGPPAAYGVETYVMGLHRSEANLSVAQRENSSILMEDNYQMKYEGFDPNSAESYIAISLMQSAHLEQSLNFASKVQDNFGKIGRSNRGVKQAGFLVLYRTTMPSVLIETGFLTNKEEEKFLADKENQEKIAGTIFEAFKEYKTEIEKNAESIKQEPQNENPDKEKTPVKKEKETKENKAYTPQPLYKSNTETNKEKEAGISFKVQFATSPKPIELKPENFKGLLGVNSYKDGETYKYVVGSGHDFEEATKLQAMVREKGYKDAFVIAFNGSKRIPVKEALEILKNK
jgi:N-acetylmuramoyl-L-alanine amidase